MKREEKEEGEKGEKKYPDTFEDTDDENPPDEEGGGGGGGGGERGGLENFGTNERIRKIVNEREIERQEGDEEVGRERGRGRGIGLRHRCFMSQCRERIRGGSHREERERGGGGGGGGMREEEERERVEREHRRIQSESGVEPVRQKQRITRTTNQETPSKHPNETDFTHATHTTLHPLPLPQSYPHPHQHPYHHATPYQYPLPYPQCTYNPPNTLPITGKRKHYTSLTKDYITGLAFLARVDRVARVMVGRSMSIMEVRQCSSPALRLLVPQSEGVAAEGEDKCLQDLHSLQQTISQCSSGGKGIVTPELRIYCRSLL
ncbi:hypothetical protein E2C01_077517 [Portunus trituberculatus]|uniref:Uncharacterized protein n=1 Tax=Portunus trituberculatus TaxID=210409 RepID=A0A5B7IBL8_PORTR|nr:hypothetical protein [Portunus trituberculatus]